MQDYDVMEEFNALPEQDQKFIDEYIKTRDASKAARAAKYRCSSDGSYRKKGHKMKNKYMELIKKRDLYLRGERWNSAILSTEGYLSILSSIAEDPDGPKRERVAAAKAILDYLKTDELSDTAQEIVINILKEDESV